MVPLLFSPLVFAMCMQCIFGSEYCDSSEGAVMKKGATFAVRSEILKSNAKLRSARLQDQFLILFNAILILKLGDTANANSYSIIYGTRACPIEIQITPVGRADLHRSWPVEYTNKEDASKLLVS
ncbi:hypothetical protein M434DRAFT_12591 [Hypoxylon sp. CO27-5]|nr:hypothetical protein M434DRAFT_12591 [Hypoxylon sp. CO27-5]